MVVRLGLFVGREEGGGSRGEGVVKGGRGAKEMVNLGV